MVPPSLKLIIVQGPREGETLEFKSGSTVRIGRLVRGNNLPIKDSGISSKHLTIEFESGRWVLQDLDSSNGTTLNSTKIPPNTPFDLRDGDSVKLGEYTSILIRMVIGQDESNLRRNPRRQAKAKSELDGEIGELLESGAAVVVQNQRKGRPRKVRVLKNDVADKPSEVSNLDKGLGFDQELENAGLVEEKPKQNQMNLRVTRSKKDEGSLNLDPADQKILDDLGLDCVGERIEGRKIRRGIRRKNLRQEPLEKARVDVLDDEDRNLGEKTQIECAEDKENVHIMTLGEENSKEAVSVCQVRGSHHKVKKKCNCDVNESYDEVQKGNVRAVNGSGDKVENGSACGVKGGLSKVGEGPDLEKMTLGDWFEYMEVHLRKQIIDETEAMIEGMRRKAERVHEYMIQQKKGKGIVAG